MDTLIRDESGPHPRQSTPTTTGGNRHGDSLPNGVHDILSPATTAQVHNALRLLEIASQLRGAQRERHFYARTAAIFQPIQG